MNNINELKDKVNTKTLHFVLLTIVTVGIYPIIWLFVNKKIIEDITNTKISSNSFLIWIAICVGLSGVFSGSGDITLDVISGILSLATSVLYVVWAFRARKALQEYVLNHYKLDLKMNRIYTGLFTVYYINYCINDLNEVKRKQEILNERLV
ncbi:DUF4234 domain-containing protein [Aliivibrio sifiae]